MAQVDRQQLLDDSVRRAVRESGFGRLLVSDEDLRASLAATLAARSPAAPVWIFAYGSLIWSPLFRFVERRVGMVRGYHRGLYLRSFINRGSPDSPGLVLALDRGGMCRGIAYRLPERGLREELRLLWRREMLMGTYRARWVNVSTHQGPVRAVAFVVNRHMTATYAGRPGDDDVFRVVSTAEGHYGTCSEYVVETAASLEAAGIADRALSQLARRLRDARESRGPD